MGAGHGHRLHYHAHSVVHRAPAHLKLLALLGFVLVVVATPPDWFAAYAVYLGVVLGVLLVSTVPPTYVLKRLVMELPFVVFALLMPFIATGPRQEVLGITLSEPGLLAGWALLAKGTLGVLAGLTLAATTEARDILVGLERLRLPQPLAQIMGFMVRYVDVVTDEMRRMRISLESRGFAAHSPRHWPVIARSAGALFIRSYERGERVHLAMVSRGHTGSMSTGRRR